MRDGGERAGQENVQGYLAHRMTTSLNQNFPFVLKKTYKTPGWWWLISLMPALRKQRQAISEFENILVYTASSRITGVIQRNPVSIPPQKPISLHVYLKVPEPQI